MDTQPEKQSVATWRKSSASADGGNCVEVASANSAVLVRDTQDRSGTVLEFTPTLWRGLVRRIRGNRNVSG
jgi:Domain of unknown function (DUF397)